MANGPDRPLVQLIYPAHGGPALAETVSQGLVQALVPMPGGGLALYYTSSNLYYYLHPDWLGTSRVGSTTTQSVMPTMESAPFGEEYGGQNPGFGVFTEGGAALTSNSPSNQAARLIDFAFRRYSPSQGRWISPDPAGIGAVNPANPQTWNRYAYVMNNPLSFTDPSGLAGGVGCRNATNSNRADCMRYSANCTQAAGFCPIQDSNSVECMADGAPIACGMISGSSGVFALCPGGGCVFNEHGLFKYEPTQDDGWAWVRFPLVSLGGAANEDSWSRSFIKSFIGDFSIFGPGNDPRPSCFGNFVKDSVANFAGIPGVDTVAAAATAHYGISQSLAQAVPNTRVARGGISPSQWLAADEASRLSNAGKFSLWFNADVAMAQAFFQNELPAALAGECK